MSAKPQLKPDSNPAVAKAPNRVKPEVNEDPRVSDDSLEPDSTEVKAVAQVFVEDDVTDELAFRKQPDLDLSGEAKSIE